MNSTPSFGSTALGDGISQLCARFFDPRIFYVDDNPIPEIMNCILNIATSITAICGNLLVLLSIWNTPSLHSPSHVLLCGLAMADFGVGLLVQPLFVVFSIARIYGQADVICTSGVPLSLLGYLLCGVSLVTLTAISLDRFLALHLHLRYKSLVTIKRVICLLFAIWVSVGCAVTMPLLKDYDIIFQMSLLVTCLCICLIIFSYLYIFRVVRRHQTQIQKEHQQHQAQQHGQDSLNMVQFKNSCFTMFLVSCIFVLYYLPYVVVAVWIAQRGYTAATQIGFEASSTVLFVGASLNPLVYCLRLQEMRVAFRQTLNRCCFFKFGFLR